MLDTTVTPELAAEGLARDVVRVVQTARRDADLAVSDRITLVVDAGADVAAAVTRHAAFIAAETLADAVVTGSAPDGFAGEVGEGDTVRVRVTRV